MSDLLDQLSRVIRDRRSVKPIAYDCERMVDDSLVWRLLENARWAPSHGLTEPWKFHVFTGSSRQVLASKLSEIYQLITPPDLVRTDKMAKLRQNPLLAPVVIACCVEKRGGEKISFLEEVEAVACAVQNIMLSATAAGLGSFWSSPPVIGADEFGGWLDLNPEDLCVGLLYLGWPEKTWVSNPVPRRPIQEKVVWHADGEGMS